MKIQKNRTIRESTMNNVPKKKDAPTVMTDLVMSKARDEAEENEKKYKEFYDVEKLVHSEPITGMSSKNKKYFPKKNKEIKVKLKESLFRPIINENFEADCYENFEDFYDWEASSWNDENLTEEDFEDAFEAGKSGESWRIYSSDFDLDEEEMSHLERAFNAGMTSNNCNNSEEELMDPAEFEDIEDEDDYDSMYDDEKYGMVNRSRMRRPINDYSEEGPMFDEITTDDVYDEDEEEEW